MAKFKVGEIVIKIGLVDFPRENGEEVTVVAILPVGSPLIDAFTSQETNASTIFYRCDDGYSYSEHNLKKKPFKGEEDVINLFTSLDNRSKIKTDELIEETI